MIVLNFVSNNNWRLVIVCLFVVVFSAAVSISKGENLAMQDLIASNAAYAAVLVVYVGSTTTA
jgi:hypothetical protein